MYIHKQDRMLSKCLLILIIMYLHILVYTCFMNTFAAISRIVRLLHIRSIFITKFLSSENERTINAFRI